MSQILAVFSFLSVPLGWLIRLIYNAVGNYGLTLILFTIATKVLLFPLSIKQQKSMAKQAAYQPLIQEIQKKWAKDKNRQNEELMKLQQEYGFSPTAGCLPMLVQLPIMIALIEVIYKPLRYVLGIANSTINELTVICESLGSLSSYGGQNNMIQIIGENPARFTHLLSPAELTAIQNFDMNFLGINLAEVPTFALNLLILVPILAILTTLAQQVVTLKINGTMQSGKSMWSTTAMSTIMFGYISFTVPAGVTIYWIVGNLFGIVQAFVLRKMYNPAQYKAELEAEIQAKKEAKKKKKTVEIPQEDGTVEKKEVTQSELDRLRLERARERDRQKYGDE